jgi:hypothetical protein
MSKEIIAGKMMEALGRIFDFLSVNNKQEITLIKIIEKLL